MIEIYGRKDLFWLMEKRNRVHSGGKKRCLGCVWSGSAGACALVPHVSPGQKAEGSG